MDLFKQLLLVFILVVCSVCTKAQSVDSTLIKKDSSNYLLTGYQTTVKKGAFSKSLIVSGLMIAYGSIAIRSDPLQDIDESVHKEIWVDRPHSKNHIDNYLRFVPAVAVYGLNIIGVKGKNNFRDRTIIYFMSNVFLTVTVSSVKKLTHELRPDGSDYLSFPSGHAAQAFASAEFLRQEYKDVSVWYGIAGYVTAAATGVLRLYNNKHWLSDVVAGAGVGIASTKLAYWIYPSIAKKLFPKKEAHTIIMPYYQNKEAGLSMLYIFH